MTADERKFTVKPVLDGLCAAFGYSNFGYRMQGIFAHVLMRVGARITEVNAHGHPDVKAELQGRELFIQVKALIHAHAESHLVLAQEDVAGIGTLGDAQGYLAVLDCAVPISWILITAARAQQLVSRPTLLATLHAERCEPLSSECTDVFLEILLEEGHRLAQIPFAIAAQRALRGEAL